MIDAELPDDRFAAARAYIESQIIGRDFQLIDQSDIVAVYCPTDARDRRIPVYLCGFPGAISPFLGILYQEAFETSDQLVARLATLRERPDEGATR